MERLAATQMLPQSRLIAPNPLVTLGLQIHEEERVLLCVACEQAVRPSAALHHAKKEHGLTLASPADREVFDTLGEKYNLYRQPSEVPRRTFGLAPVEGIKVIEDGWICRHCSFAAPMQGTLQKHWRQADHRARAPGWLAFNDGAIRGSIQTFFNPESQAWFEVVPELAHAAPGDFFEAYLRRYGDSFDEASQSLPGPVTFKENPPINRLTFWDVHLAPWLRDKRSVFHLRSLMTLTRAENRAQDGPDRLCRIVPAYLVAIRTLSEDASLPVRSMLMTYPRVENHGEVWRGLASNATLLKYGTLLQRFAFAILATRSRACPTNYRLPLTAFEEKRVDEYQHSLRQPPPIDPEALVRFREREIAEFHAFIALFLLKRGGENKSSGKGRFDIPIECLCAIEAVHEDGRLKSPVETTPVFARLEYLIRGTILYEADTAATVHGVPLDIAFESLAMENLHVSALSPYNVIVDLQRAVSRLAFLTVRPPSMRVSEDMDTFYHADKVLNFPEYRAGIRSGLEALKQRLEALLFGLDIPYRTPDKVADDWNCEDRGYGFLSNNDFLQSNRPYLRGLLASSAVTIGKRNAAGGFILNAAGVVTVLQRDTAFLECLMPLLFIGSSSSRGAEFVEHKITNGTMPRTLFMNGPDLWLVTRRWKQKVHQVFVPVLVPPELAAIVIRYLAIIRPGIVELVRAMRGDNASILHSEYLWASAGALMDENRLSSLLETFTRTHCGVALTLRPHRHLQLEIFRTRLGSEAQIEDDEEDDVYAMCRSHSLETSRKVYAPETNHLPSLSSDLIHRYEHACLLWHQVLGLRPDFPLILSIAERRRQREAAENLAPGSPSLPQQDSRAFLNHVTAVVTEQVQKLGSSLQASVRKNVVEAVAEVLHRMDPAAGRGSSSQVTEEVGEVFSALTTMPAHSAPQDSAALAAVHAFFGSSPWQPPVEDQPQHTSHPSETIPLARSSSRESDTLAMVGQLLKVDAPTWKLPEQKEVVQLTVECEQNFVAVLPPGGGKSLGYQVAASKEQKEGLWTVVMCPNRSLLNDQLRSATKLGLKTHLWAVSEPACNVPDGFNLLFVALESIVTRKFKAFFRENEKRLVRIVYDEVHQLLTERDYRDQFLFILDLAQLPCQHIFLTATLPHRLVPMLLEECGHHPNTRLIRAPCLQANLRFIRVRIDPRKINLDRFLHRLQDLLNRKYLGDGSGILFRATKAEVRAFDDPPVCISYSGWDHRDTDEQKWLEGREKWLVATSTCVHGIDNAACNCVILANYVPGLSLVTQACGRGGRDGEKPCTCIIVDDGRARQHPPPKGDPDFNCLTESAELLANETECRRSVFMRTYDQRPGTCADIGGLPCDICDPDTDLLRDIRSILDASDARGTVQPHITALVPSPARVSRRADFLDEGGQPPRKRCRVDRTAETPMSLSLPARIAVTGAVGKEEKALRLGTLAAALTGFCAGCWVSSDTLGGCQARHGFRHCPGTQDQADNRYRDFEIAFKIPGRFEYCFHCGFPQIPYFMPPCHPPFEAGRPIRCDLKGFVKHVAWAARWKPAVWEALVNHFNKELTRDMSGVQYAHWLGQQTHRDRNFYNGLELALCLWTLRDETVS